LGSSKGIAGMRVRSSGAKVNSAPDATVANSLEDVRTGFSGEDGTEIGKVRLWRGVTDPELAQISETGIFQNKHPGYGEVKYFSSTPQGAGSYGKQAYQAWPQDGPYTLVETAIPGQFLEPHMNVLVDGNVPAIVIPEELLPYLNPPIVLNSIPIDGLR
jgi:hypothetical protein